MKNNFNITIISGRAYSFYEQGLALATGFQRMGYNSKIIWEGQESPQDNHLDGDVVIGIGSWRNWDFLYNKNKVSKKGIFIPWLVSDDKVLDYIDDINKFGILFTTSNFCRKIFVKYGIKEEIIKIIPEGLETDFWHPIPNYRLKGFRDMLSLPRSQENLIFLTIGQDGTSKGVLEVVEALNKSNLKNYIYLVKINDNINSFYNGYQEKKLINGLGLNKKVKYIMGFFSNEFILNMINICDIYIAPSRHEGFGLPHVQAMLCEKPVVTCKGTAAEETSIDNYTGRIVSSKKISFQNTEGYNVEGVKADVIELSKSISGLAKNKITRKKFGKQARRHAIENYDCAKIARMFLEQIKKIKK